MIYAGPVAAVSDTMKFQCQIESHDIRMIYIYNTTKEVLSNVRFLFLKRNC